MNKILYSGNIEIWQDVYGYEGLYKVSNLGNVFSCNKNIILKPYLRGARENNKYLTVDLNKNKNRKQHYIHRLVASSFIDNPNNLPQVNHIDGNKLNNNVNNLEWCSGFENQQHAVDNGLRTYTSGINNKANSLSYEDVLWIKNNFIKGDNKFGARSLSRKFNVDKDTILNLINNITYKDVKCKYKLFVCGDIHGHYQELISALKEAGFNRNKYNHKLIVVGDFMDRGKESLSVYKYLKKLTDEGKAIVTKGNHDDFLLDFMGELDANHSYGYNDYYYLSQWNGVNETIDDFLHSTSEYKMFAMGLIPNMGNDNSWDAFKKYAKKIIIKENPNIISWLKNLPDYYETKNYIFTHGSIDPFCEDWHNPFAEHPAYQDMTLQERWRKCHWDDGSFITKNHQNTDKTVVVGHFSTAHLREMWQIDSKDGNDHSILRFGNNIFIDTCTILTKKVNVLIIDDEEILDNLQNKKEVK